MAEHVTIIILTAPGRFPERLPLLRYTIARALAQELEDGQNLEVLVLDDGPEGCAWPEVAAALPGTSDTRRLRYVALPPDDSGRVNMRLKRNVGLLLSRGDVVVFFDDDDWRSRDSVRAQLELLRRSAADVARMFAYADAEASGTVQFAELLAVLGRAELNYTLAMSREKAVALHTLYGVSGPMNVSL